MADRSEIKNLKTQNDQLKQRAEKAEQENALIKSRLERIEKALLAR